MAKLVEAQTFSLYVTHVDGDGHFLKISGQQDTQAAYAIESALLQARENFEKGIGAVPPAAIHEGIVCAAKYKDGSYYRAKIINTATLFKGLVGVLFIDFGNKDIISISTIRFLDNYDPMLIQIKGQAYDHYLSRIIHPTGRWEEPLLFKLQSLLCYAEYPATVEKLTHVPIISIQFKGTDLSTHLVANRFGVPLPVDKQEAMLMQLAQEEPSPPPALTPTYINEPQSYPEHVPFLTNQNFPSNPASAMRLQQGAGLPINVSLPPPSLVSQRLNAHKALRTPVNLKTPVRQPQNLMVESPPTIGHGTAPPFAMAAVNKPQSPKKVSTYKSRLLEVNSKHEVYISYCDEGPELFAVQLVSDGPKLQEIMEDINRRPHKSLTEPPMLGTVCLGRMSGDRIICRAIVTSLSGSQCKLYFVDFGDTEKVSYYDIFDIPEEFIKPHVFAMRFCLSGMKKLEKGPYLNEAFKQLINGKHLNLKVVAPEGPPLIQYGELYVDGKNVFDLLQANMKDKLQFKYLQMLSLGSKASVLVSYVDSCLKFYVQLSDQIDALNAVMDAVKEHCDSTSSPGELPIGAACCARFPDDGNWYRAQIRETRGGRAVVTYVDYGNEQEVEVADLRTITPNLITLPAQALKCALKGFENKPVETKTSNQLEMLALEKTLMAHIVGVLSNDTMMVSLVDDNVIPALDIAKKMAQLSQPRSSTHEVKPTTPIRKDAPESFGSPESGSEDGARRKSFHREKSFKGREDRDNDEFGQRGGSFRIRDSEPFERSGPSRHSDRFGSGRPDKGDRFGGHKSQPPASADDEWNESPSTFQAPAPPSQNRDNRDRRKPRPDDKSGTRPSWKKDGGPPGGNRRMKAGESTEQQQSSVQDRLKRDNFNKKDEWEENKTDDWGNKNSRENKPYERRDNRGDRRDNWGEKKDNFQKRDFQNREGGFKSREGGFQNREGGRYQNRDGGRDGGYQNKDRDGGYQNKERDGGYQNKERDGGRDGGYQNRDRDGGRDGGYQNRDRDGGYQNRDRDAGRDGGYQNRGERGDRPSRSNFSPRDRANKSFGSDGNKSDRSQTSEGIRAGRAPPYKARSKFTQVQYKELADPVPVETEFAEPTVESGAQHEVSVTWIISPQSFYTQILSQQQSFVEMMHRIPEIYKGVKSFTGMVPVGASVLARYPDDGVLYRAKVVSVQPFSKFIVQYVDFGNKQLVEAKDIWQLDRQLLELPKMAVHCSLLGVAPKDGEWKTNSEVDKCFNAPRYQCVFQDKDEGGKYLVSMYSNGVSVADTLVEKDLAAKSDQQTSVTLKDEEIDLTIIIGQQITCKVTHVVSYEKFFVQLDMEKAALVEEAIANFDKSLLTPLTDADVTDGMHVTVKHEDKIYRAILNDISDKSNIRAVLPDYGMEITTSLQNLMILPNELTVYYYQSLMCRLNNYSEESTSLITVDEMKEKLTNNKFIMYINNVEDIFLVSTLYDPVTGKKIPIFEPDPEAYEEVVPLCLRSVFNYNFGMAYISHLENLNEIYLQKATDTDKIAVLLDEMYKFYEEGTPEALTTFEAEGLCVAKSSDGNWYRATIISTEEQETKVQFSDYGNSETLPNDALKKLDPKFYEPCAFALIVSLGLVALQEDALDKLREWTAEKEIQVTLAFGTDGWLASLHLDGVDLSIKLVEEKLANPQLISAEEEKSAEEPISLPPGTTQVYISHIDSPGQFWLQMSDKIDKIEEIQAELQANVESYFEIENRDLGTMCVAKYSADDQWYRAEILDSDSDITTVRFIDYGNTDVLDNQPELLKAMPENLASIERYAVKCSVNAVPTGTGQWSEPASDFFTQLVGDTSAPVDALIVLKDVTTYVDIFVNGQNLTDKLVAEGHASRSEEPECGDFPACFASHVNSPSEFWIQLESATTELQAMEAAMVDVQNFPELSEKEEGVICAAKYPDDAWYRAQIIVDGSEGTEVLFMDYGNASIATELRSLPEELKAKPALSRKCALQKPRDIKTWSRRSEIKFNELAADGATIFNVQFIASGDISIVELYLEGKSVTEELVNLCEDEVSLSSSSPPIDAETLKTGKLVHFNTLNEFYMHLDGCTANLDAITEKLAEAAEFEAVEELKIGSLCAAFWTEDEQWYRAKILQFNEKGYNVQFIDYGNTAECEEFRKLPEELVSVEPVAKCFSLANALELESVKEAAKSKLDNLASDESNTFQIDIEDSKKPNLVNLLVNGENIKKILVSTAENNNQICEKPQEGKNECPEIMENAINNCEQVSKSPKETVEEILNKSQNDSPASEDFSKDVNENQKEEKQQEDTNNKCLESTENTIENCEQVLESEKETPGEVLNKSQNDSPATEASNELFCEKQKEEKHQDTNINESLESTENTIENCEQVLESENETPSEVLNKSQNDSLATEAINENVCEKQKEEKQQDNNINESLESTENTIENCEQVLESENETPSEVLNKSQNDSPATGAINEHVCEKQKEEKQQDTNINKSLESTENTIKNCEQVLESENETAGEVLNKSQNDSPASEAINKHVCEKQKEEKQQHTNINKSLESTENAIENDDKVTESPQEVSKDDSNTSQNDTSANGVINTDVSENQKEEIHFEEALVLSNEETTEKIDTEKNKSSDTSTGAEGIKTGTIEDTNEKDFVDAESGFEQNAEEILKELESSKPDLDESMDSSNTVIENKSFESAKALEEIECTETEQTSEDKNVSKDSLDSSKGSLDNSKESLEKSNDTIKTPERENSKDSINTDTGYTSGDHDKSPVNSGKTLLCEIKHEINTAEVDTVKDDTSNIKDDTQKTEVVTDLKTTSAS